MQCLPSLSSACTTSLVAHGTPGHEHDGVVLLGRAKGGASKQIVSHSLMTTLLGYMPAALRWVIAACQMIVFVILLLPGFMQLVAWYIFSRRIARNVRYGTGPRQHLDLYWPPGASRKVASAESTKMPVVIYITGGAWIVGYKAWGALLAQRLSQQGVIVACIDYRNFPQARANKMLEDVNTGIAWVMEHIADLGGDSSNVTLVGQSAGAHLGSLALFHQTEQAVTGKASPFASPVWSPAKMRAFVSVSGIYDLPALANHVEGRGLGRAWVEEVMTIDGKPAMQELSPLMAVKKWAPGTADQLPEIVFIHGLSDQSAPHVGAIDLHRTLKARRVRCSLLLLEGKGHTSLILEGAMKGGPDLLAQQVLSVAAGHGEVVLHRRLNLAYLCDWAEWICPF